MPETKGISLEELSNKLIYYKNNSKK